MTSARQQLVDLIEKPDLCFSQPSADVVPLQIEAARELLAERRQQIPVLDRRARDTGTSDIREIADIIPLLFSHTTYKSYPQSFIKAGQWDRMTKWLGTVSTRSTDNVELDGIVDIDDWIDRLHAAGHLVLTTSGTSGKVSFLNRTQADHDLGARGYRHVFAWPNPVGPEPKRHFFYFGPKSGPYAHNAANQHATANFARPDSIHFLSEDRLRLTKLTAMAEMRLRMADGSASPSEIAAFEAAAADQAAASRERMDLLTRRIIELHNEPLYITGMWVPLWDVMQRAKEAGVQGGDFHPATVIAAGGGLKGATLPDDYREQILAFFGNPQTGRPMGPNMYSMSEQSWGFPGCEAGNYHLVPWIVPFILDREGEAQVGDRQGISEGRYGFLDLSFEGRWNGLITGDRVTIDYREACPCGRAGAVIKPTITRYGNLGEDDKIGCAGTIDAYIRGAMAE